MKPRFLEPSISQKPRFLEPKLVSLGLVFTVILPSIFRSSWFRRFEKSKFHSTIIYFTSFHWLGKEHACLVNRSRKARKTGHSKIFNFKVKLGCKTGTRIKNMNFPLIKPLKPSLIRIFYRRKETQFCLVLPTSTKRVDLKNVLIRSFVKSWKGLFYVWWLFSKKSLGKVWILS